MKPVFHVAVSAPGSSIVIFVLHHVHVQPREAFDVMQLLGVRRAFAVTQNRSLNPTLLSTTQRVAFPMANRMPWSLGARSSGCGRPSI